MQDQLSVEGNISMIDIAKEASTQDSETPTVSLYIQHTSHDNTPLNNTHHRENQKVGSSWNLGSMPV